jgi:phosphoserine phosphatase
VSLTQVFSTFSLSDVIQFGCDYDGHWSISKSNAVNQVANQNTYSLYLMSLNWEEDSLLRLYQVLGMPLRGILTRTEQLNPHIIKVEYLDACLTQKDAALLAELQLDFALLPAELDLNQISLIVSDMDSTFIQQEVIDEIGAEAGIKAEIAEITERAMQGELDFTQSLRERVQLLKGVHENKLDFIFERLQLSDGIFELVNSCKTCFVHIALVSGGFSFFVEKFQSKFQLYRVLANQLEFEHGVLTGHVIGDVVDAKKKSIALQEFQKELVLDATQIAAMGDGANDIDLLKSAGLSIAYRAKSALKAHANCHLQYGDFRLIAALIGQPV